MGRQLAEDISIMDIQLETKLLYHLQYNHYPPVHADFIPACVSAIDSANVGAWDEVIELPNGKHLTAGEIVEGLHLDCFVTDDEYPEEDEIEQWLAEDEELSDEED